MGSLSFGGGGISFGGGNRLSVGSGAGGLSFGMGARGNSTWTFNPNRNDASSGRWGGTTAVPLIPPTRWPNAGTTYTPPTTWSSVQPSFLPPAQDVLPPVESLVPTTPAVPTNELPATTDPEPMLADPEPNTSGLVGRQITPEEVERAKEFFQGRILDLAKVLQKRLPPAEYDPEQVTAIMIQHGTPVASQIQILDSLKQGDYDKAKELWVAIFPRLEIPFRPSRFRVPFFRFFVMIEQGHVDWPIVVELFRSLPPDALRPSLCCGADDLLVQIEEEIRISQVIGGASAEAATEATTAIATDGGTPQEPSTPERNQTPYTYTSTELQTGEFDKPAGFGKPAGGEFRPYGKPGEPVALPTGPVNLVYHPKLPDRQVVVVNAQTVMVGTGGRGSFRMQQGYVAEALGLRIGRGTPLAENRSELVRTGVVVVNPTGTKVRFAFGGHEVTLEPGYQQAFPGKGEISFDRGDGKQTARYSLERGTYEFVVGGDGWDLQSRSYQVTISNAGNLEPLKYTVQGERSELAPEEAKTHTSQYPILIRFDRGDGSATKQIRWDKGQGTLQIAVNPHDNLWDLFEFSQVEAQKSILQPKPDFVPAF